MNDMRAVIVPKSDQINADDLLAGSMTITITKVDIKPGTEQPVSIGYEGDGGKPFKPCKSMARVMVHCWGADANQYVGRSMTLYCDPKVKWGGMEVGGIRISHMSHISATQVMALTVTKGSKKPFTVQPLKVATPAPPQQQPVAPRMTLADWIDTKLPVLAAACKTMAEVQALQATKAYQAAWSKASEDEKARMALRLSETNDRVMLQEAAEFGNSAAQEEGDDWPGPDPDAMRRAQAAE